MTFTTRRPALSLPPLARASRWTDVAAANHWTTQTLRGNETRLRAAAARGESVVELRGPVPASAGELFVRVGAEVQRRDVSCAVVRMDLSSSTPVVHTSLPDDLPVMDDAWDLLQVLSRFREDGGEDWLDPRQALDDALAADPARAGGARDQWWELTGGDRTGDAAQGVLSAVTGAARFPVEGTSWSRWADWFAAHLTDVAGGRVSVATDGSRPALVRSGEFDDEVAVGEVVAQVLTRREEDVARWRADAAAPRRLHVWADLGRPVGTVTTRGPDLDVAATAVAVVLQREEGGEVDVLDAHPEVPLDDGLRARFPVAASVLGASFGPSLPHTDVLPWAAQRALLSEEPADVLVRWRHDVRELLTLADADLGRALLRLGGAVVPANPRGWLERMLWRAGAFPWAGSA